jgi:hypothetical protein
MFNQPGIDLMMTMDRKLGTLSASALAVLLAGCSSGSDGPNTGTLSLSVSDGPVHNAKEVCLEFDEIEIKKVGSPPTVFDSEDGFTLQQVNLLDFQGSDSAPLFMDFEVEAGEYQWIRLGLKEETVGSGVGAADQQSSVGCSFDGSYVLFWDDLGNPHPAFVPSGAQTGLKINSTFVVAQGGATSMTADFDLQKTLTEPPGLDGTIVVRPSIRLMNDLEVGSIFGTVSETLATQDVALPDGTTAACAPTVYAFRDSEATAGELDVADSIASGMVKNENDPTVYEYEIGFLEIGESYDIAFSCDEGVSFDDGIGTVTIANGGDAEEVNFPVPQPTE